MLLQSRTIQAYDTIARKYKLSTFVRFGFSQKLVKMMGKSHDGTMAQFVVDEKLSKP